MTLCSASDTGITTSSRALASLLRNLNLLFFWHATMHSPHALILFTVFLSAFFAFSHVPTHSSTDRATGSGSAQRPQVPHRPTRKLTRAVGSVASKTRHPTCCTMCNATRSNAAHWAHRRRNRDCSGTPWCGQVDAGACVERRGCHPCCGTASVKTA